MKKILKAEFKKFETRFNTIMKDNGANKGDDSYEYVLNTQFGKLSATIHKDVIGNVYACFDEPDRASKIFNCDQYNGKYNFHYSSDSEYCLNAFEWFIERTLAEGKFTTLAR